MAVARRGGSLKILDPVSGESLWEQLDERVEADDMFVALEEKDGSLFWCTNHGYYGFATISAKEDPATGQPPLIKSDRMAEWVGSLSLDILTLARSWRALSPKQGATRDI